MRYLHTHWVDLTAWTTFVEVCDAGSVSAAAANLGYSQSAASRQVAGLERDLGVQLLERLPRGARATPEGLAFLRHARVVVSEAARARSAVTAAAGGQRELVAVGGVPSAIVRLIPQAMSAALEGLPEQRFTLTPGTSSDLEARVVRQELDVAVVTDYPPGLSRNPALVRTRLVKDEMVVILPEAHRHATKSGRRLDLANLAEEVWAEDHPGSATVLAQAAAKSGFTPRIELDAGDLMGKVALVATGHAVALVPRLLLPGLRPDVVVRRLRQAPVRWVYAVIRASRPTAAATAFVAALSRSAAN
jgi:DNA-binding transcriptional LysR family regulator